MWWVALLACCVVMLAVTPRSVPLRLFLAGLLVMQVYKIADLGSWQWLASGATWAAISVASWRHSVTFSAMMLLSALCYMFGRAGGFDFTSMVVPIILADLFGWAALLIAGGPSLVGFILDRGSVFMDSYNDRSTNTNLYRVVSRQKASEKIK